LNYKIKYKHELSPSKIKKSDSLSPLGGKCQQCKYVGWLLTKGVKTGWVPEQKDRRGGIFFGFLLHHFETI
jgi:hypothetical protein